MSSTGTTNVPGFTFTSTGFVAPQTSAILTGVEADFSAAFNQALDFNLNTPQGQLSSSEAANIAFVYQQFVIFTQLIDPAYTFGRYQDAIGRIYFQTRIPSTPTSLQVTCSGANVTLPGQDNVNATPATIQDLSGNLYQLVETITLPAGGGSVVGTFNCIVVGPIAVPAADAISIYGAIAGWDTVDVASGILGTNDESRQAFETRRQDSVAKNSLGPIGAVIGAVAAVAGVTDYYGVNNPSSSPVTIAGVTIAAHSIYIAVAGSFANINVAQAILSKLGAGAGMVGTTTITAYDSNPLYAAPIPYSISFTICTPLQIYFHVTIPNGPSVPPNAATLIQNALVAAVSEGIVGNEAQATQGVRMRIGQTAFALTYLQAINALGSWAQPSAIGIGSTNTADWVGFGSISGTTFSVHSTTSGTLADGQFLQDLNGVIVGGTEITGGSGSSWTVSQAQTVGGATFTANSSGTTTLTTSAVTGTIEPGDLLVGSGIAGGTTVVAQLTGTPGGAGTYQTSATTTLTNIATTSYTAISTASGDQTSVSVQGNQEPQISPVNIVVQFT